jgi:glycerate kinase
MLVAAAVALGAKQIVLGLGGSATNDGGAGMLTALGVRLVDQSGSELPAGALALTDIARLGGTPAIAGASVVAATDVNSPLLGQHGASVVYAEQKGARPEDLPMLDAALERLAAVLERDLPGCPSGFAEMPGAGSAGGLGAAVLALGGRNESGIGLVWRLTGLENALDEADVVITGEGSFDHQSLRGKVVGWVASAAKKRGLSCLVLAGRATVHRKEAAAAGITEVCSLADHFIGDMTAAMNRPSEGLRAMAAAAASRWRR